MSRRRKAREIALQALYAVQLSSQDWEKALSENVSRRHSSGEAVDYAEALVERVVKESGKLDLMIEEVLENWDFERISVVDLLILKIALVELIHFPSTPKNVIINEAVEVAHRFSSKNAGEFVNGILDELASRIRD
ncbi:MAG: transcription antitermination factor NusB [Candidatus Krumholzibacteriota bacterium]|nr:transcription antitermination factor NusB [Candidatus Krumholzibacteriota bacterium]